MSETIMIQVRISEKVEINPGVTVPYNDAIYYTPEEWAKGKEAEVATEKAARIASFVNAIKNPVQPKEMTKEELENVKAELVSQVAAIDSKIAETVVKK